MYFFLSCHKSKEQSMKKILAGLAPILLLTVNTAFAQTETVIVNTRFQSTGSWQFFDNNKTALTTNLPDGNWVWGAVGGGGNSESPAIFANWDTGNPQNVMFFRYENTALGIPIGSNGTYEKPAKLTFTIRIRAWGDIFGAGFWPNMTRLGFGSNPLYSFTGFRINNAARTIQLYENGTARDSVPYPGAGGILSITINTVSGELLSVTWATAPGAPPTELNFTSSAFTDAATQFAGAIGGGGNTRVIIDNMDANGNGFKITGSSDPLVQIAGVTDISPVSAVVNGKVTFSKTQDFYVTLCLGRRQPRRHVAGLGWQYHQP